jgi:cell wall-associated NlpC family hydrolase
MARYTICTPTADILADPENPHTISTQDSQMLFGEVFIGEENLSDWIKGHAEIDGYAGHVHKKQCLPKTQEPTHIVDVRLSHIYGKPDFKTPPVMPLSFLSRVCIDASLEENGFAYLPAYDGWVFAAHLTSINTTLNAEHSSLRPRTQSGGSNPEFSEDKHRLPRRHDVPPRNDGIDDIINTALLYLHTPYLYGGRSSLGIDCSGLVQNTLLRHGINCPRDSGDQEKILGHPVPQGDLKRGDLVFFKGHVGIMVDDKNILNATARHMRTLIEPLNDLIEQYGDIISCKCL